MQISAPPPAGTPTSPTPGMGLEGSGLRVRVLGGLEVNGAADAALGDLHARFHVRALLGVLAASADGVDRDQMLEALWPRQPAAAARNRLYHTVHLLRQALSALAWDGDWVHLAQGRVRLDPQVWTDAHCVRLAAQRGADGRLGDAELHDTLRLCTGEWMPGLDLGELGAQLRSALREHHAELLRHAAQRRAADGDSPGYRGALAELLRVQPTEEWAYRQLMRLDLDAGRLHAVLKTYEVAARTLAERLGLRPGAATGDLATEATTRLGAAGTPASPEAGLVPRRAAQRLVGREPLLAMLATAWSQGGGVFNLHGLSGVGKTALTAEALRRALHNAPGLAGLAGVTGVTDGAFWVDCAELAAGETLALVCSRALCLAPVAQRPALDQLLHMLRTRRLVLVLDDADTAAEHTEFIAALLARTTGAPAAGALRATVVLVTRARIEDPNVHAVAVPALELPGGDMPLDQASRTAGCMLFQLRCPQPPDLADSATLAEVVRLVRQLDGMPLAIELAAARSATMTAGEISRQLEQTLQPLEGGPVDLGSRHRSMQAALDWSVQQLHPAAAQLYDVLSVYGNWFRADALPPLLARLGTVLPCPAAVLDELLRCGLLEPSVDASGFRLLHLPRAHARGRARASGLWPQLLQARTEQLHARLLELPFEYESPAYTPHLQAVAKLHDDTLALLEYAQTQTPCLFVDMAVALGECWAVRAQVDMGLRWCVQALHCAQVHGMQRAEVRLHTNLARLHNMACQYELAAHSSQAALVLAQALGEPALVAQATSVHAAMLEPLGRGSEAHTLVAKCMRTLNLGEHETGHWTLAARAVQQRVFSGRTDGPTLPAGGMAALRARFGGSAVWVMLLSAACRQASGTRTHAEHAALADELAQAGRALQSPYTELMGCWERAWCELGHDRLDACQAAMHNCYRLCRGAGLDDRAALAARCQAELHWRRGEIERAAHALGLSAELLVHQDDPRGQVEMQLHGAMLAALRGEHGVATESLRAALAGVPHMRGDVLHLCTEVAAVLAQALTMVKAAAELAALLRHLDQRNQRVPVVQRFRARWLAAAAAEPGFVAGDHAACYTQLRQRLLAFEREVGSVAG